MHNYASLKFRLAQPPVDVEHARGERHDAGVDEGVAAGERVRSLDDLRLRPELPL